MKDAAHQLEIGLIGCGEWGKFILRDLVLCGARVRVVARSPGSRARAEAGGAHAIVSSLEQLGRLDGAVVATPATTHVEVIEALLRLQPGLRIYCEKPLCMDPDEADRMAHCHAGEVFVMHKWRYHPGIVALGEIARSGELGPVHGLRLVRVQWGHPRRDVDAVATLLPHDVSIMLEILGFVPEPRAACIDRADGEAVMLWGLLGTSPWASVHVSARELEARRECQLYCRDGVARLSGSASNHVEIMRSSSIPTTSVPTPERRGVSEALPLRLQIQAFLDFLRGDGGPPRSSAAEEARCIRAIDGLRRLASP